MKINENSNQDEYFYIMKDDNVQMAQKLKTQEETTLKYKIITEMQQKEINALKE